MSQPIQPPAGRSLRSRGWRSWFSWRSWRTLLGIVIVVALAIVIGVLLTKCAAASSQSGGLAGGRNRPTITVGIAKATLGDVPITVTALGTVTPEATVSVISRVTGQLNAGATSPRARW